MCILLQLSVQELELSYEKEKEKLQELCPDDEGDDPNGKLFINFKPEPTKVISFCHQYRSGPVCTSV